MALGGRKIARADTRPAGGLSSVQSAAWACKPYSQAQRHPNHLASDSLGPLPTWFQGATNQLPAAVNLPQEQSVSPFHLNPVEVHNAFPSDSKSMVQP